MFLSSQVLITLFFLLFDRILLPLFIIPAFFSQPYSLSIPLTLYCICFSATLNIITFVFWGTRGYLYFSFYIFCGFFLNSFSGCLVYNTFEWNFNRIVPWHQRGRTLCLSISSLCTDLTIVFPAKLVWVICSWEYLQNSQGNHCLLQNFLLFIIIIFA